MKGGKRISFINVKLVRFYADCTELLPLVDAINYMTGQKFGSEVRFV